MTKLTLAILFVFITGASAMAEPKSDVEELMNALLPFGEKMLVEYGEFIPYGGAMKPDGQIVSIAGDAGEEHPASQDIINLLKDGYRLAAKKDEYKATAIFYDVRIVPPGSNEKTDAIAVALDHKDGYSVTVFFPYTLTDSHLQFGEVFAQAGANDIFID